MDRTNVSKFTNQPISNNIENELSADEKQRKFFDNYYSNVESVDGAQFDIIRGFLLSKKFDESTVNNLAITLLEVAKEQQIDPTDLITQLDDVDNKLKLNTLLCILLNTTRNRTSILGFNQSNIISDKITRTILA
tara:strand:- start:433 stop:837 length:405 start_codon:yes stop_codon:yes gene_type:complete